MKDRQFISDIQKFTAVSAVGVSALRGQGAGVIGRVRERLCALDLSELVSYEDSDAFSGWLDDVTEGMAKECRVKWGAARKALNLFLRDCLYSKYLCPIYQLDRLEAWLEIPLDSVIAGQLKRDAGRGMLPVWPGLKRLKKEDSDRFQEHAQVMAERRKLARIHLDVGLWVNNR